jgi:peptidoglycan hydrolase-like protein with peptidoglycan-binding domain
MVVAACMLTRPAPAQNAPSLQDIIDGAKTIYEEVVRQQQLENQRREQEIQPGGLTRGQVIIVQQILREKGHDVGEPDGVVGPKTRTVVGRLQAQAGMPVDGYPTQLLLDALLAAK